MCHHCLLFSGQFCKQAVQANQHVLLLCEFRHAGRFCDICSILLCHWADEHNHWLMLSELFEIYKLKHVRALVSCYTTSNSFSLGPSYRMGHEPGEGQEASRAHCKDAATRAVHPVQKMPK